MGDSNNSWQDSQAGTQQQAQIDQANNVVRDLQNVPSVVRENYNNALPKPAK